MKIKTLTLTLCGLFAAGSAFAANAPVTAQSLQQQINALQQQVAHMQTNTSHAGASSMLSSKVVTDPNLSSQLFSFNANMDAHELDLLNARKDGQLGNGQLFIGGKLEPFVQYSGNDTAPNKATSKVGLEGAWLGVAGAINNWTTTYVSFNGNDSNNISVENAYVVFGNLAKNPMFVTLGKRAVDFGDFSTVNVYTAPLTRSAFAVTSATQASAGYDAHGVLIVGTVFSPSSATNAQMASTNKLNDAAINANYHHKFGMFDLAVGAGYLNGSNYLNENGNGHNGAWDLNTQLTIGPVMLNGEYVRTAKNASIQGTNYAPRAWNLGTAYNFNVLGRSTAASLDYSRLSTSSNNGKQSQWVFGVTNETFKHTWLGLEYARIKGTTTTDASNQVYVNNTTNVDNRVTFDATVYF